MPLLEQACGKEADILPQLTSIKQEHSAQAAIAVTPFDSGNQVRTVVAGISLVSSFWCFLGSDCLHCQ